MALLHVLEFICLLLGGNKSSPPGADEVGNNMRIHTSIKRPVLYHVPGQLYSTSQDLKSRRNEAHRTTGLGLNTGDLFNVSRCQRIVLRRTASLGDSPCRNSPNRQPPVSVCVRLQQFRGDMQDSCDFWAPRLGVKKSIAMSQPDFHDNR